MYFNIYKHDSNGIVSHHSYFPEPSQTTLTSRLQDAIMQAVLADLGPLESPRTTVPLAEKGTEYDNLTCVYQILFIDPIQRALFFTIGMMLSRFTSVPSKYMEIVYWLYYPSHDHGCFQIRGWSGWPFPQVLHLFIIIVYDWYKTHRGGPRRWWS